MSINRLELPDNATRLLLHSCCAPCSGDIMLQLLENGIDYTIYFYNPNIHPRAEYELRKEENLRFAEKHHIPFVDGDYDRDAWFQRARGLEHEPERGIRCSMCFDMRFARTALYAHENDFSIFSSTLGISRWKDMDQINASGVKTAAYYPNLQYWTFNWRKAGGSQRMISLSKQEQFYQQEYCGCVYSLRDTNRHRLSSGRKPIKIGVQYYGPSSSEPAK